MVRGRILAEETRQDFLTIGYPSPLVRPYVSYYFEVRQAKDAAPFRVNGLPSANSLLMVNLGDASWTSRNEYSGGIVRHAGVQVLGQSSVLHSGLYDAGVQAFFVKLRPGVASVLFREEASSFTNQQADLSCFWRDHYLEERLREAPGFRERVQLIELLLFEKIGHDKHWERVLQLGKICRAFEGVQTRIAKEVGQVVASNWFGQSTARREFLRYVGFSPKYCQRAARFKNALKLYQQHGSRFLAEDYGYTDFSHFVREAKGLTGLGPAPLAGR